MLSISHWRMVAFSVSLPVRLIDYGLRDYSVENQLGLEPTLEEYIQNTVLWAREVRRVLKDDGVFFLNIGDSYNGSGGPGSQYDNKHASGLKGEFKKYDNPNRNQANFKPKDLMMVPHRVAIALQNDGWWVRDAVVWVKAWIQEDYVPMFDMPVNNRNVGSVMPGPQQDRPTSAYEYIFLLTKSRRYYFDLDAERATSGASFRNVWRINLEPTNINHFATFPKRLADLAVKFGTSEKGECPECGKAWVRVTENKPMKIRRSERTHSKGRTRSSGTMLEPAESTTIGWKPQCNCNRDPVPQIVLDPFSGSGTTVMVANALGRRGIGIDLSWDYLQLAKERTGMKAMEEWINGKEVEANLEGLPMFQEIKTE